MDEKAPESMYCLTVDAVSGRSRIVTHRPFFFAIARQAYRLRGTGTPQVSLQKAPILHLTGKPGSIPKHHSRYGVSHHGPPNEWVSAFFSLELPIP